MGCKARTTILLALVFAARAGSVAVAQQGEPVIAPRAQLTVTIFNEPTLSGKYNVDLDGTFEFPLVGRVQAGGLTAREVESELTKGLADGYLKNPQVTVDVGLVANQRVFVMGEVRSPGTYQFAGEATLIEALSQAGSTTPIAAHQILIIRPTNTQGAGPTLPDQKEDAEVLRVDVRDLQSSDLARSNLKLRNGDTVFVPRAQLVYISGQVRSPGAYTIEGGTTVLQVLSLAGGVTDRGAASRIKIIRVVDGTKKELKVKLSDPAQPGDTIVVPERFF